MSGTITKRCHLAPEQKRPAETCRKINEGNLFTDHHGKGRGKRGDEGMLQGRQPQGYSRHENFPGRGPSTYQLQKPLNRKKKGQRQKLLQRMSRKIEVHVSSTMMIELGDRSKKHISKKPSTHTKEKQG